MEQSEEQAQAAAVDEIYEFAANLMVNEKRSNTEVVNLLVEKGLDQESAQTIVSNLEQQIKEAKKKNGQKDMLWGAVWCIGGTVATVADFGYIFWGAIVFGAIQFFKGVANSSS